MACLLIAVAAAHAQPPAAEAKDALQWRFKVFLDDKEIGWHSFDVATVGDHIRVESIAEFDVKFLFITAYRYRHRNVETWDSQGLVAIDAFTNANGKESVVRGERGDDYFRLSTDVAESRLPSRLKSFGYWTPSIHKADKLLNSQTGDYESVEFVERGVSTVTYRGASIPARRYDIMVRGLPISIWYCSDKQRWLALESMTGGGRLLRYEPLELPEPADLNRLSRMD